MILFTVIVHIIRYRVEVLRKKFFFSSIIINNLPFNYFVKWELYKTPHFNDFLYFKVCLNNWLSCHLITINAMGFTEIFPVLYKQNLWICRYFTLRLKITETVSSTIRCVLSYIKYKYINLTKPNLNVSLWRNKLWSSLK